MLTQVSALTPNRRMARAIAAALLLTLIAGGVAAASGYFPQRDEPYPTRDTGVSRNELPIYWYGPHHSFDH